ncbi:MAG: family 43 glycosylhydrolase [Chitinispirillaceae bacterium]|nr:family 43 glycosylhydrolase [Chitinispirillaceae bacterium]
MNRYHCVCGAIASIRRVFILPLLLTGAVVSFGDNPAVQTCYTADPAPFEFEGRVYMLLGHDADDASGSYKMPDWKCYSTTDMVNWTDHGVILSPGSMSWATTKDANASQIAYRDGKFYFYVSTTASGGVAVGVAVSDSPIGPFTDPLGKPLIPGNEMTGCNATHSWRGLDPTVFVDDDGQAYLYWGNNVCYWVKLNDDMISLDGSISCIAQNDPAFGPDYEEGPWFYKRNNLYYLLYPSKIPESIHYATSTGPTGPWKYGGEIMPVQQGTGSSSTIHPGMLDFGGKSFFFYHNGALPGGGSYKRSVCIEEFTYNTDGSIPKIPATTGGITTGVSNLNPYDTTEAETICWESGIKTAPCSEGGIMVNSISNGDYIKVEGVDFEDGADTFEARVACGGSGGAIELRLDDQDATLIGTCSVTGTGGLDTWKTVNCDITGATGKHDLYLKFTGGSGDLFNFNWWKFTPVPVGMKNGRMSEKYPVIRLRLQASVKEVRIDFILSVPAGTATVRLFDAAGRQVVPAVDVRLTAPRVSVPIIMEKMHSGVYFVEIEMNKTTVMTDMITLY